MGHESAAVLWQTEAIATARGKGMASGSARMSERVTGSAMGSTRLVLVLALSLSLSLSLVVVAVRWPAVVRSDA